MKKYNTLIFVYNSDSGFFSTAADIAHKALSPSTYSCRLCSLTHGIFTVKKQWRRFLMELRMECEFYHRDEFCRKFQNHGADDLPAIFTYEGRELITLLSREELAEIISLEELIQKIRSKIDSSST